MKITKFISLLAPVVVLGGLSGCAGLTDSLPLGNLFAVTDDNRLLRMNVNNVSDIQQDTAITGMVVGETVKGSDFRPATGELYAMGSTNIMYKINVDTAVATAVGVNIGITPTGSNFGFDFNPVADKIRVTSDTDENIRLDPVTGGLTLNDTSLTPSGGTYTGVAYTPVSGGVTTLFAIDSSSDAMFMIGGVGGTPSPNGGAATLVGSLGVDVGSNVSFDIDDDGTMYMSNQSGANTNIYTVASGGTATLMGSVSSENIVGIALRP